MVSVYQKRCFSGQCNHTSPFGCRGSVGAFYNKSPGCPPLPLYETLVYTNRYMCPEIEFLVSILCYFHYSLAELRDFHQIPKLIINQLRWLHYLVNGKVYTM